MLEIKESDVIGGGGRHETAEPTNGVSALSSRWRRFPRWRARAVHYSVKGSYDRAALNINTAHLMQYNLTHQSLLCAERLPLTPMKTSSL